jgi:hypothetical protein
MKSITDNLSLQDLLTVLLPGVVTVFFLAILRMECADKKSTIEQVLQFVKTDWTNVLAYFGAAYFVGYVVYVLSSFLDKIYDRIKHWALGLDSGKEQLTKYPILNYIFPHLLHTHLLVQSIIAFKNDKIGAFFDESKPPIIDAYQFAFRWMMKEKPEMYAEAERYLATARFFRSMVFVWAFGAIIWLIKGNIEQKWYALLLLCLCIV